MGGSADLGGDNAAVADAAVGGVLQEVDKLGVDRPALLGGRGAVGFTGLQLEATRQQLANPVVPREVLHQALVGVRVERADRAPVAVVAVGCDRRRIVALDARPHREGLAAQPVHQAHVERDLDQVEIQPVPDAKDADHRS